MTVFSFINIHFLTLNSQRSQTAVNGSVDGRSVLSTQGIRVIHLKNIVARLILVSFKSIRLIISLFFIACMYHIHVYTVAVPYCERLLFFSLYYTNSSFFFYLFSNFGFSFTASERSTCEWIKTREFQFNDLTLLPCFAFQII